MDTTTTQTLTKMTLTQIAALVFVVGLAIQQACQLIDNLVIWIKTGKLGPSQQKEWVETTKAGRSFLMALGAFLGGASLAGFAGIRLMSCLPIGIPISSALDFWVTAFFLASGTEASNSILKLAGYLKEGVKRRAAAY